MAERSNHHILVKLFEVSAKDRNSLVEFVTYLGQRHFHPNSKQILVSKKENVFLFRRIEIFAIEKAQVWEIEYSNHDGFLIDEEVLKSAKNAAFLTWMISTGSANFEIAILGMWKISQV